MAKSKRFGLINRSTGKVENVILWAGDPFTPPHGYYVVEHEAVDIDDSFDFATLQIIRRDRTQRDLHHESVAALEAEIAIKQKELDLLKKNMV